MKLRAYLTVKSTVGGLLSKLKLTHALDNVTDLLRMSRILLELISSELDLGKALNSLAYIQHLCISR
jgi:hypothetical protein